ncbi:MAG: hypothetical protein QOH05_1966 [Acetobacteraceae bacterium]|nr:hypothetical protein [Acetobacteraceae bacterium]
MDFKGVAFDGSRATPWATPSSCLHHQPAGGAVAGRAALLPPEHSGPRPRRAGVPHRRGCAGGDRTGDRLRLRHRQRRADRGGVLRRAVVRQRLGDAVRLEDPRLHGLRRGPLFGGHVRLHGAVRPGPGRPDRGPQPRRSQAALRDGPGAGECREHRHDRRRRGRGQRHPRHHAAGDRGLDPGGIAPGVADLADGRQRGDGAGAAAAARGAELPRRRHHPRCADAVRRGLRAGPGRAELAGRQLPGSPNGWPRWAA